MNTSPPIPAATLDYFAKLFTQKKLVLAQDAHRFFEDQEDWIDGPAELQKIHRDFRGPATEEEWKSYALLTCADLADRMTDAAVKGGVQLLSTKLVQGIQAEAKRAGTMDLPMIAWRMMRDLARKDGVTLADLAPLAMFGFMFHALVDGLKVERKVVTSNEGEAPPLADPSNTQDP